jgi:multidrug efflux pump subunit AcrA (membrane-fusion protein)
MKKSSFRVIFSDPRAGWFLVLLLLIAAALTYARWWPILNSWVDKAVASRRASTQEASNLDAHAETEHEHSHDEHGHDQAAHSENTTLALTPQALKNLGLTAEYLRPIERADFYRTITIPAIVVAKPGRTDVQVSSPMIGIVQHVHAVSGEAVVPGDLMFEVRLTYEDLVDTQTQLLKNLADLAIEKREIERLEEVTRSGAVASKLLLERQYALQKLQSSITAQRAALKLHGLSDEQVDTIIREQRLLRDLKIVAPELDSHAHDDTRLRLSENRLNLASYASPIRLVNSTVDPVPLIIDRLNVSKGQGVQAGEMLCTLSDYSSLYIEGKAFELDAPAIADVAAKGWLIEAVIPSITGEEIVPGLKLAYVANAVDEQSRTLSLFVNLPNTKLRDEKTADGQRFVTWKYRVGQRLEIRVPVEAWEQQIVLPVEAAVKDGADWFVFQQNGDHFDRIAVHVKYRDQRHLVIENDGAIFPGDIVAMRSAHQMLMAIKNESGGGVDPHAGHNH